jgi:hypothetical protein
VLANLEANLTGFSQTSNNKALEQLFSTVIYAHPEYWTFIMLGVLG